MYPTRELTELAARKTALQEDIVRHRAQCAGAAARVARPLEWLDRMLAIWRLLSPLAQFSAVSLGFFARRTVSPRLRIARSLLRWAPLVFGIVRLLVRAGVETRGGFSRSFGDAGRSGSPGLVATASTGVGGPAGARGRWR